MFCNNKRMLTFTMLSLSVCLSSTLANAADSVQTGNVAIVQFQGAIIAGACNVSSGSMNQVVNMGGVTGDSLSGGIGKKAPTATPFSIYLTGCDNTTYQNVSVSFTGATTSDPTVLAVDNSMTGGITAKGVGITIEEKDGTALALDGSAFSKGARLLAGNNQLGFNARYMSTADTVSPGAADGLVNVNLQYK